MFRKLKERKWMDDTKRTLKLQAENMDSMFVRILLGSVNDRILNSRSELS